MILLNGARSPLDSSFTIPGLGIVISVRSMLKTICVAGGVDQNICDLVNQNPEEACTTLVAKGDVWLKARIKKAFDILIAQVLEGVDCQKKDWQEVVIESIDVSFSSEGIAIEIDESAILQNVICALARKAIDISLEAPINTAVRKLKEACTKLSAAKTTSTATPPSSTTQALTKAELERAAQNVLNRLNDTQDFVRQGIPGTSQPQKSSKTWVWWAGGLTVLAGGIWFATKK